MFFQMSKNLATRRNDLQVITHTPQKKRKIVMPTILEIKVLARIDSSSLVDLWLSQRNIMVIRKNKKESKLSIKSQISKLKKINIKISEEKQNLNKFRE